jgi:hypothetical protein
VRGGNGLAQTQTHKHWVMFLVIWAHKFEFMFMCLCDQNAPMENHSMMYPLAFSPCRLCLLVWQEFVSERKMANAVERVLKKQI